MFEKPQTPPLEKEKNLEKLLNLRESYDSQIRILNQAGILTILPETMSLGIVGIDNKEHAVPTFDEIKEKLEKRKEELGPKMKQGFTKLLLVPAGMSLDELRDKLKQRLLAHKKEGKLLNTDNEPVNLDLEDPVYRWDGYNNADKEDKLIYYPKSFDQNHNGKTKKELIESGNSWRVSLVEDLPDLPEQGKGKTVGGRKQLEANKSPTEYLRSLQLKKEYASEDGFTPEEWITYFLTHLETKNQIVDNWQAKGKASYLTGAYFPGQGAVPYGYWFAGGGQAGLGGGDPGYSDSYSAARSAVGVY